MPRVSSMKPVLVVVLVPVMTTVVVLAPASSVLESRLVPLAPGIGLAAPERHDHHQHATEHARPS